MEITLCDIGFTAIVFIIATVYYLIMSKIIK